MMSFIRNTRIAGPVAPAAVTTLVRRFVETADERCPLAGIWLAIPPVDNPLDDHDLLRLVTRARLLWRAVYRLLTSLQYRIG